MDRKKIKKINIQRKKFLLLILISTLFMSIGYASINSVSLDIKGIAQADNQEGIFITDYKYVSDVNADITNSKIENIYQSTMKSNVVLSNTDPNSSITYEITIYNSTETTYYFNQVKTIVGETTYDNENITYKLEGLEHGDILTPSGSEKAYKTFKITFYYKDGTQITDQTLNSYLNFEFEIFYNIDYINIDNNGIYPTKIVKGGELSITLQNILSEDLSIKLGDTTLILNQDYTYDETTGQLKIPNITDDVIISNLNELYGYTVLEYITSDGNQYIDTGVLGRAGLKSDITLSFNNLVGTNADDFGILGARRYTETTTSNNNTHYERIYLLHYYNGFAHGYGMYYNSLIRLSNNKKYTTHTELNIGEQFVNVDGNNITNTTYTDTHDIGLTLYLFAINQDGSPYYKSSINLFHCKIYDENDNLIRDFLPVMRNSDGELGLYDIVNNVFYANQGTGAFTTGTIDYNYLNYITTTGTEYIDTGVNAKTGLSSEIELSFNDLTTANDFTILGARKSDQRIYLLHYYNSFTFGYGNYYSLGTTTNINTNYTITTNLGATSQTLTNGTNTITKNITTTYDLGLNLYLFALNHDGNVKYMAPSLNLYSCKIYDGENLVRSFIPAQRISDNKIGLLDIVNNKFYLNQGNTSFTGA